LFEKIGEAAEWAAMSVSRRELLGRLGRGAMALSAGLAGLALTGAGKPSSVPRVCNEDSSHECFGLKEGDLCYSGAYRGLCTGPKQRGKDRPDRVACYCDIGDPDQR
jgi:hypothetical protein